jgi:hypothetical protein
MRIGLGGHCHRAPVLAITPAARRQLGFAISTARTRRQKWHRQPKTGHEQQQDGANPLQVLSVQPDYRDAA